MAVSLESLDLTPEQLEAARDMVRQDSRRYIERFNGPGHGSGRSHEQERKCHERCPQPRCR